MLDQLPETYTVLVEGQHHVAKVTYTEDRWWVVRILHVLHGQNVISCGKGRSVEIAERFAKQAYVKTMTGGL